MEMNDLIDDEEVHGVNGDFMRCMRLGWDLGITQMEVAHHLGLAQSTISNIERNRPGTRSALKRGGLSRWADYIGCERWECLFDDFLVHVVMTKRGKGVIDLHPDVASSFARALVAEERAKAYEQRAESAVEYVSAAFLKQASESRHLGEALLHRALVLEEMHVAAGNAALLAGWE